MTETKEEIAILDNPEVLKPLLDIAKFRAQGLPLQQGASTFLMAAEGLMKRPIVSEEDYSACVNLSLEAGRREKVVLDKFNPICTLLHNAHRALTGLRAEISGPITELKAKLERKAAAWFMEQQRIKKEATEILNRGGQQESRRLQGEAEEKIAMGFIAEGEHLLREAQMAASPVSLPDATPKLEGVRATPKWNISITDVVAVAKVIVEGKQPLMWGVKVRGKKETEDRPLISIDEAVVRAILDRIGAAETMKRFPGITITEDVGLSGTGRIRS